MKGICIRPHTVFFVGRCVHVDIESPKKSHIERECKNYANHLSQPNSTHTYFILFAPNPATDKRKIVAGGGGRRVAIKIQKEKKVRF
jgi:hypothetical protein